MTKAGRGPQERTWRPLFAPIVAVTVGTGLLAASLWMWFGLPDDYRAGFSPLQVATLVVLLLAVLTALGAIARTRAVAEHDGLTVVNVFRVHRLAWADVLMVHLRSGDPWVQLDLADGTTLGVMAIQSADGARARRAAGELAAVVAERTRTTRND